MVMRNPDGGPAFPQNDAAVNRINNEAGMTLRDYFAAAAMNGLCGGVPGSHLVPPNAAKLAYDYADAMLVERDKK